MDMNLLAVNITFREETFYKRWRLLARDFGHDITLVGPKYYEYLRIGEKISFSPSEISEGNFRVKHIDMRVKSWLRNDWFSFKYLTILIRTKPDLIYLIGYETKNVVLLSILYKFLFKWKVKLVLFTMRGTSMPMSRIEYRWRWMFTRRHFDLINVHYPHARQLIRSEGGYKGPVNLQTQIGVDKDVFFPSLEYRRLIRDKLGISDHEFVFGAAIRIEALKGIFDILDACQELPSHIRFLVLGDGKDFKSVKDLVFKRGLSQKIILTGRIEKGLNVCMYMNAMDCFVHVPKTAKDWVDTFPLAVVQAMACRLPVIASDSGAMQYQIGLKEMIVPEGDPEELRKKMITIASDPVSSREIGVQMYKRVLDCFEIRHLNKYLSFSFESLVGEGRQGVTRDQTDTIATDS